MSDIEETIEETLERVTLTDNDEFCEENNDDIKHSDCSIDEKDKSKKDKSKKDKSKKDKSKKDNKYDNYIIERKKELILDLIKFIGYESYDDPKYITFSDIQTDRVENYVINMLDALRTVFKTYNIRSMTRQNKDKRFCLNITRQLLQNIGYTLKMKTYPLIRNNIITSSTKYKIVKKN